MSLPAKRCAACAALLLLISNFPARTLADPPPVSGVRVPQFAALDAIMQGYMQIHGIGAGTAAVMRDGVPIYHRSFGWRNEQRTLPLGTDAVVRVGGVTEAITAAAIRKLISRGDFGLNSRVFSGEELGTGLLDHFPLGNPDSRLKDITVEHLLQHRGGWDASIAGDLTYREQQIAQETGLSSPPGRDFTLKWILAKPLQFDPGSKEAFSNIGYLALGLIVEQYARMPYIDYVRQEIFSPLGARPDDVLAGRTFRENQDSREPFYDAAGNIDPNVFWPKRGAGPNVPAPYGGWDHEARIGQDGLVADPLAILEFLDAYQVSGADIGRPSSAAGSWRRDVTGELPGTSALARQRGDGINYVVFFNKEDEGSTSYASDIGLLFDSYFDQPGIPWPTVDVTSQVVVADGDFNDDGFVDAADLSKWRLAVGKNAGGDSDGDGDTDGADFLAWQRSLTDVATINPAAVPEPTGLALMLAGAAMLARRRSRPRRP